MSFFPAPVLVELVVVDVNVIISDFDSGVADVDMQSFIIKTEPLKFVVYFHCSLDALSCLHVKMFLYSLIYCV